MQDSFPIVIQDLSKSYKIWNSSKGRLKSLLLSQFKAFFPAYYSKLNDTYSSEFHALNHISFSIAKGESIGIVGLNGSGKSTLLQIIAGTLTPTCGSRKVHGRVAALLELGSGFNPEFTGKENIYLNGSILGLSKAEIDLKYDRITAFAEIGEFVDRPVKTYSSGMVVRLAFAVLTQVNPDILIVDEALAVGDVHFQHKCIRFIKDFLSKEKTLLFVSHDPGAVKTLCQRAILLHKGKLIKDGDSEEILNYYNGIIADSDLESNISQYKDEYGNLVTRSGSKKVEFLEIDFVSETGNSVRSIEIGSESTLVCRLKVNKETINPTIGFVIRDRLGTEIYGINTHNLNYNMGVVKPEEVYEVRFKVKCNLGVGSYSITVASHAHASHIEENYDWIDNAVIFKVMPRNEKLFVGCVELPTTVNLSKIES